MKTLASLLVFIPIVSTVLSVWKSLSPKFSQILWTPNPNWTPRALEDLPGTWGHGKGSGEWPGPCLQSQDSSLPISGWISGLGITWPFFSFMAPWHHGTMAPWHPNFSPMLSVRLLKAISFGRLDTVWHASNSINSYFPPLLDTYDLMKKGMFSKCNFDPHNIVFLQTTAAATTIQDMVATLGFQHSF